MQKTQQEVYKSALDHLLMKPPVTEKVAGTLSFTPKVRDKTSIKIIMFCRAFTPADSVPCLS